jgi:hypothetical protein
MILGVQTKLNTFLYNVEEVGHISLWQVLLVYLVDGVYVGNTVMYVVSSYLQAIWYYDFTYV